MNEYNTMLTIHFKYKCIVDTRLYTCNIVHSNSMNISIMSTKINIAYRNMVLYIIVSKFKRAIANEVLEQT